jgi:periplasmic divalent cation tolerance protein
VPTILITAPPEAGADLARLLIEERLAACVNRIDCESTYRWDGAVHEESEVVLLAKTDSENVGALVDRVEAEHPHDTPCIERFDEDVLVEAYEEWRETMTL